MVVGMSDRPLLPPEEYEASLARKRMAAGALFRDAAGRVLLVDPVYKEPWDLPGGAVEAEESPHAACRREVREELGLDRPPGRVLAVDWVPSRPGRAERLIMIYDGGVLSAEDIAMIRLADGELKGFAFVDRDAVAGLVTPLLARRVAACLDAVAAGSVAALENGGFPEA
jgi:8-oxo-dGTP diphosphatase